MFLASQLLPAIVEQLQMMRFVESNQKSPWFVSIALDKDEYIYSLTNKQFVNLQKNRYELPPWRVCGDWAIVRVALLGANMENVAPVNVWYLVYRNGQWQRMLKSDEGQLTDQRLQPMTVPPYARRCFNWDHKEVTDETPGNLLRSLGPS